MPADAHRGAARLRGAIFFDRDGTLILDSGYTFRIEDLRWRGGAIDAIRMVNEAGLLAIVVTNQSGVARGLYTQADVQIFHDHMQKDLAQAGARIDAFYMCPFHSDANVEAYRHADHPDRKPNPGMILRALAEWQIDPALSAMIGDLDSDVRAAQQAGLVGFLCGDGNLADVVRRALAHVGAAR